MSWILAIVSRSFLLLCTLHVVVLAQKENATRPSSAENNLFAQQNRNDAIKPRIIGGDDAQVGRYPYMVSLLSRSGFHDCGGSLIAKDVVLTAAHCVGNLGRAHVGRFNRFQYSNDVYDDLAIVKTYVHPLYIGDVDTDDYTYDFALLKLEAPSQNDPVEMNAAFYVPDRNYILTAIGFGQTLAHNSNSESNILQEVDLNYISNEECNTSENGDLSYDGLIKDAMMCAKGDGKDACYGDSGGPLLIKRENSPTNSPDLLVGVTSWGYECADPEFPGIYSRVSDQIGWLTETLCQLSETPPSFYDCPTYGQDGTVPIIVQLAFDDYPAETSWKLICNDQDVVYGQGAVGKYGDKPQGRLEEKIFVPSGGYCTFTIKDEYGDGLCCDVAGSYKVFLFNDPSTVYASGEGDFGKEEVHDFRVPVEGEDDDDGVMGEGQIPLLVNLLLDDYPKEIGWRVDRIGVDATTVYNFPPGSYRTAGAREIKTVMLEDNQIYSFHIMDSAGDGMPGGTIQVLLGTQDINDRSMAILERRGSDFSDSFEVTFESWKNNGETLPPTAEGDKFLTIEFGLDKYPAEIGFQLRVRERSASQVANSRNDDYDDGEIVAFRPAGYFAGRAQETVQEQIGLPSLAPNMVRDFIFIISDQFGDGLCCDWGIDEVVPGYAIYEGEASDGNFILDSQMKGVDREIKYFALPTEQTITAPTPPPTQQSDADTVSIAVSLKFDDFSGSSTFYIDDVNSGERVVNYPCSRNAALNMTYSIPPGVFTFTVEKDCGKVSPSPYTMGYEVNIVDDTPNRPPLLQGTEEGSHSFIAAGSEDPVLPMTLEFTTGTNASTFSYYLQRLDTIETNAFITQVASSTLEANSDYKHEWSIQPGGLYEIILYGATSSSIVDDEVLMTVGDKPYPIQLEGLAPGESQSIKLLTGSLPDISPGGANLTLRVKFDERPLDFSYLLLEDVSSDETAADARSSEGKSSLPEHRIYAFGPQNEDAVANLGMQEYVEMLRLPSFTGEKKFTLLLSDAGGDGLCCKQGNGGPVELFEGSDSDGKLIYLNSFQGTDRLSFTFVLDGKKASGNNASSGFAASPAVGLLITCLPVLLFCLL